MPLRLVPLSEHVGATARPGQAAAAARDHLMQTALRLLSLRSRSEHELEQALVARGSSKRVVREVLGRLRELGYIDDRTFATERVERWLSRGYGAERIRAELERTGIDPQTIERVLPSLGDERRRARAVLTERYGDPEALRGRERARAVRWLASRGYREEILEEWSDAWTE